MKTTPKKFIALTLCSVMLMGSFGGISEAHDRDDSPPPPPPHRRHYNSQQFYRHHYDSQHHRYDAPQREEDEGHSGGEVSTAAILGAVVGAIIAKTT